MSRRAARRSRSRELTRDLARPPTIDTPSVIRRALGSPTPVRRLGGQRGHVRSDISAAVVSISLGLWLPAAVGCGGGGSDVAADTEGTGSGGSEGGSDESGGAAGACEVAPGRVGLQRLTRAEYNRTVFDLFGVTSNPADAFPPDSATDGFDNNAASLTVSPQLASLLLGAAETVAAEAMANAPAEILICDPAAAVDCERTILAALARRVYRRPASEAELDDLMVLVDFAETEGDDFAAGIEYALAAMLMAPQFLYRGIPPEGTGPLSPGEIAALDDWAVASRLSYFLWGSTPDDALLDRAAEGALHDPDALRAEFDRMLGDPKAAALYEGLVTQWLQLGKLAAASPDPVAFPQFDEALRAQMLQETRLFFEDLRARDGSVLELLEGTRTFASSGLADIYGVSGVEGDGLVAIDTDPARRAGVLTMPAILTMTSGPQQPNIVKRGVWLAEAILCASPPPPPEGIPPAPDPGPGETERERLERHRLDPSCASCHDLIDPLGFGFEHYDALGAWRDDIEGEPADDLGQLPDGRSFEGVVELAELLASGDEFPTCATRKVMTYALGRAVTDADACVVSAIGSDTVTADAKLSDLLWAVVTSDAFAQQEGGQ